MRKNIKSIKKIKNTYNILILKNNVKNIRLNIQLKNMLLSREI
jgi:hypothetical protein